MTDAVHGGTGCRIDVLWTSLWLAVIFLSGQPIGFAAVWLLVESGILNVPLPPGSGFMAVFGDGTALAISVLAAAPVQLALLAYVARRPRSGERLIPAWTKLPPWPLAASAALLLVALSVAGDAVTAWAGKPMVSEFQKSIYASAAANSGIYGLAAIWLVLVVCAPVVEEMLFRGLAYAGYKGTMGKIGAMTVATAIWAVLHVQYDAFGIAEVAAAGALFGWARIVSGTISLPIALHAVMNAYATLQTAAATGWPT